MFGLVLWQPNEMMAIVNQRKKEMSTRIDEDAGEQRAGIAGERASRAGMACDGPRGGIA